MLAECFFYLDWSVWLLNLMSLKIDSKNETLLWTWFKIRSWKFQSEIQLQFHSIQQLSSKTAKTRDL